MRVCDDVRPLAVRRRAVAEDRGVLTDRLRALRAGREMRTAAERRAAARLRIEEDRVTVGARVASGGRRRGGAPAARVQRARIGQRTRETRAAARAAHARSRCAAGTPDLIRWTQGGAARPSSRAGDATGPGATAATGGATRTSAIRPTRTSAASIRGERCDRATTHDCKAEQSDAVCSHRARS
jgi:hypothetical protein